MDTFTAFVIFVIGVAIYFLPSILGQNKRNANAILALNLLLGWTLIGWVIALVWALTHDSPHNPPYYPPGQPIDPAVKTTIEPWKPFGKK